jgi:hypothetical protein
MSKQFDVGRDLERLRRDARGQLNVVGREVIGEQTPKTRKNALYGRNLTSS